MCALWRAVCVCLERDRERDMKWREERRRGGWGRGRRGDWRRGTWHDDSYGRGERGRWHGEEEGGEEEEEEEENALGNSRLYSALIDPQDVPRKGIFYEVCCDTV